MLELLQVFFFFFFFGEGLGTQTIRGEDFEPYFRTMPHAEYPSGSACACKAFAEFSKIWFGFNNFNDSTILNDFGNVLTLNFAQFSSVKEPLTTPAEDVTLTKALTFFFVLKKLRKKIDFMK